MSKICGTLGDVRRPSTNLQNSQGLLHSILYETSSKKSSPNFSISPDNTSISQHGSYRQLPRIRSDDFSCQRNIGIRFPNVHSEKRGWFSSTDFQFKKSERFCVNKTVQTLKPLKNPLLSSEGRLHGLHRPFASILPCSNKQTPSALPVFRVPRNGLQMDMPAVRPGICPSSVCPTLELGGCVSAGKRSLSRCVSRRFPRCPSKPEYSSDSSCLRSSSPSLPGVASEYIKIPTLPHSEVSESGNIMGLGRSTNLPPHQKDNVFIKPARKAHSSSCVDLKVCSEHHRMFQFCRLCNTTGLAAFKANTTCKPSSTTKVSSSSLRDPTSGPFRVSMVASQPQEVHSPVSSKNSNFYIDRRLRPGLGCCCCGQLLSGTLVPSSTQLAHQSKRAVRCTSGNHSEPIPPVRSLDHCLFRQQNCSCLYSESRRSKVPLSLQRNKKVIRSNLDARNPHYSSLHSGEIEQSGRQSLSTNPPLGVASPSILHQASISPLGNTRDRPLCFQSIESGPDLRVSQSPRSQSGVHRRLFTDLEFQTGMGVPPTSGHSSSPSSPQPIFIGEPLSSSFPSVEQGVLESGFERTGHCSTTDSLKPPISLDRPGDSETTPSDRRLNIGNLVDTGWASQVEGWSEKEKHLLSSAWRPSTQSTYRKPWSRWFSWASANSVDPLNPLPQELAKFLAHVYHVDKLSLNSIMLHKSVVATMTNPDNSSSLSSHPVVSKMIKGIAASQPPKVTRTIWNVSDLRKWVENNPPLISSYFEVARHLTLLFLLLSGRRVHDLTLLRIDSAHLQHLQDSIMFWPGYGSKTDSSSFRQSGWQFINNTSSNIWNISYWTGIFLDLRLARCGSIDLNSLFVSSYEKVRPASRAVIAGWISTALAAAKLPVSAGSIRSAVNSSLARDNLPLDLILSRGNWRSVDTFLKHYYRPFNTSEAQSSSTNELNLFFRPID